MNSTMEKAKKLYTVLGHKALHEYLKGLCKAGKLSAGDAYQIENEVTNSWQYSTGDCSYNEDEVIAFIAAVFCGSSADERQPMDIDDAWYTIKEWKAEEIELPYGLNAWNLSHFWNEFCKG